ncbi:hypothetical protein P171DRAFT_179941 [Karstenula rhodostoma CBS 690.94]|uniref:Uncharacterized protein n=1 Tax=Karstenula rhodostoma CBS 690.94 TaxID=1392251 RepID=A0A9P4P5E4_9PLEO|nr:hypothetical protein P171DRAFT_179941 [Karstenula rhodostoma CBS 690.94]
MKERFSRGYVRYDNQDSVKRSPRFIAGSAFLREYCSKGVSQGIHSRASALANPFDINIVPGK